MFWFYRRVITTSITKKVRSSRRSQYIEHLRSSACDPNGALVVPKPTIWCVHFVELAEKIIPIRFASIRIVFTFWLNHNIDKHLTGETQWIRTLNILIEVLIKFWLRLFFHKFRLLRHPTCEATLLVRPMYSIWGCITNEMTCSLCRIAKKINP